MAVVVIENKNVQTFVRESMGIWIELPRLSNSSFVQPVASTADRTLVVSINNTQLRLLRLQ